MMDSHLQLIETLTEREQQILTELIRGKLLREIARDLEIAERTVKQHKKNIQKKLGVRSLLQLLEGFMTLKGNPPRN